MVTEQEKNSTPLMEFAVIHVWHNRQFYCFPSLARACDICTVMFLQNLFSCFFWHQYYLIYLPAVTKQYP